MPAIHFWWKILYVIEIGVNLHCAVFVLKEKEEGSRWDDRRGSCRKKKKQQQQKIIENKVSFRRKTENYYQQCWIL